MNNLMRETDDDLRALLARHAPDAPRFFPRPPDAPKAMGRQERAFANALARHEGLPGCDTAANVALRADRWGWRAVVDKILKEQFHA